MTGPYTAAAAAQSVIIIVALCAAPLAVDLARVVLMGYERSGVSLTAWILAAAAVSAAAVGLGNKLHRPFARWFVRAACSVGRGFHSSNVQINLGHFWSPKHRCDPALTSKRAYIEPKRKRVEGPGRRRQPKGGGCCGGWGVGGRRRSVLPHVLYRLRCDSGKDSLCVSHTKVEKLTYPRLSMYVAFNLITVLTL